MTPNEIVTELRHKANTGKWHGEISVTKRELIQHAADTIERLEAENYDLRHRTFESKNNPLTLEELRQMKGEPVFIQDIEDDEDLSDWEMIRGFQYNVGCGPIMLIDDGCYPLCEYGETWLAYRSKPKSEEEKQ